MWFDTHFGMITIYIPGNSNRIRILRVLLEQVAYIQ